jgi:hypothetical protein
MDVTRKITYEGDDVRASMLAQMLEEEGVRVEWTRPGREESRGLGTEVTMVVVQMVGTGGVAAITAAVNKFRNRVKHAKVTVEGEDCDEGQEPDQHG